ncbi:bifunctional ADP-dependent NAD(P)H-hydrate dehydratase/NAD(P)H-hydrate epimerase [Bifidobacterium catulorum]
MSTLFDDDAEMFDEFISAAFSSDDVRAMERPLLDEGVPLMRMAASATAMTARGMMARAHISPDEAKIVLLAGGGDNGGDGLFAAAELAAEGVDVTVVATGRSLHEAGLSALRAQGADLIVLDPDAEIPGADGPRDAREAVDLFEEALSAAEGAHLVIDAMTGIGLHGALRGIPAHIAAELGEDGALPSTFAAPRGEGVDGFPLVLAVDTPSGIGVDDGTLPGAYIPADVTVMFGALKPCALIPPSAYVCGQLVLVDFGFDTEGHVPVAESVNARTAAQSVRLPHIDDSKYSRGVTGLVTGSDAYPGAAVLSSLAAARSNVGMIRYVGPSRPGDMVLREVPEAVMGTGHVQAWVVGSGVPNAMADEGHDNEGHTDVQRRTIAALLAHYDVDAQGSDAMPPVVVDAGALDLLPESCVSQVLITPHAGELARLISERDEPVTVPQVLASPLEYALRAWDLTGATVLLKGAATIVVGDDGEGNPRVFVAGAGPAWLATAGSGDVLAGTLGSMLAQNAETLDRLPDLMAVYSAVGAYIHGMAAIVASGSSQQGLSRPVVYDAQDPVAFFHDMMSVHIAGGKAPYGLLGRPITASEVAERLPSVFGTLISLADDGCDVDGYDGDPLIDGPVSPVHSTSTGEDGPAAPVNDDDPGDGIVIDADRDYTDEELDALADALFARYEEDDRR